MNELNVRCDVAHLLHKDPCDFHSKVPLILFQCTEQTSEINRQMLSKDEINKMGTCLTISICFAGKAGGLGTLIGSVPDIRLKEEADKLVIYQLTIDFINVCERFCHIMHTGWTSFCKKQDSQNSVLQLVK